MSYNSLIRNLYNIGLSSALMLLSACGPTPTAYQPIPERKETPVAEVIPTPTLTYTPTPVPPTPTPEPTPNQAYEVKFFTDIPVGVEPSTAFGIRGIKSGTTICAPYSGTLWLLWVTGALGVPDGIYVYFHLREEWPREDGRYIFLSPGVVGKDIILHVEPTGEYAEDGVKINRGDPLFTVVGGGSSPLVQTSSAQGYTTGPYQIMGYWRDPVSYKHIILADAEKELSLLFECRS